MLKRHREEGFPLGHWVATQRYTYRKHKLTPDRAQRLEAIRGWEWESGERKKGDASRG